VQFSAGATGVGKIYTGSIAGSTGLSTALGLGKFRYNSDPRVAGTNFTAALAPGATYAIYRQQPMLVISPNPEDKTYDKVGIAPQAAHFTEVSGLVNDDLISNARPSDMTGVTYAFTRSGASSTGIDAGQHLITATAPSATFISPLGYGISLQPGSIDIAKATLYVRAYQTGSVVYGDNPATVLAQDVGVYTTTINGTVVGTLKGNDSLVSTDPNYIGITGTLGSTTTNAVTGSNVGATYQIFANKGSYASTNYNFVNVDGTLAIDKRPISITINPNSKI
jgi:hypothetical protein